MDNTLSILPADGASNEFPVLKAFQQYIDAEQAKARKRMLGLSIFFIVLLIVVVVTFVLVLTTVINRNQALSDRLLDYALKEREKAPAAPVVVSQPAPAPPQPSAQEILKPFIERLEREQAAMKATEKNTTQPGCLTQKEPHRSKSRRRWASKAAPRGSQQVGPPGRAGEEGRGKVKSQAIPESRNRESVSYHCMWRDSQPHRDTQGRA